MISNNPGFATLAAFQPGELFGFSMKLLDLPSKAYGIVIGLGITAQPDPAQAAKKIAERIREIWSA